MAPLLLAFPNIPCVEIGIHKDRLRDKQGRVQDREDYIELINEGRRKLWIGSKENKDEQSAGYRRHAEKNDRHLCHFFCKTIVSRILLPVA